MNARLWWVLGPGALAGAAGCAAANERESPVACARDRPATVQPLDAAPDEASREPTPTESADDPGLATSSDPRGSVCDGSDAIRLVVDVRWTGNADWFGYPYGAFFMVDGRCRFFVLTDVMQGIRHGVLSADEVAQLETGLELADLGTLPAKSPQCFHGPNTLIATPDAGLYCRCEECGAPRSTRAIVNAETWIERLAARGAVLHGEVQALATPGEPVRHPAPWRVQAIQDWPLARAMEDIPDLIPETRHERSPGARFDSEQARALQRLRSEAAAMRLIDDLTPSYIYVQDCGIRYQLGVRDELPADVNERFAAFLREAWERESMD